jgi:hypothetical protein
MCVHEVCGDLWSLKFIDDMMDIVVMIYITVYLPKAQLTSVTSFTFVVSAIHVFLPAV